ncbi:MAG: hypothetical protein ACFE85_05330 [Candidatus Hodarchaeota archaeon]
MERLIIVHWNKSTGPEPIIQYPPEKTFPSKDLFLKIWAQHELNKEDLMIELESPPENEQFKYISIIQEYENELYFLVLVYNKKKMIDIISPDILAVIGKNLLELMNTNKITRAISESFNTIKNYSKLEGEDLIFFFQDKIKYTILLILRNGVISKTELSNLLRLDYGFSTVNIDLLLIPFIRENLIIKKSIAGSKECYFLVKDLTCARVPPKKIPDENTEEKILKKYKKEFVRFYSNYDINQEIEHKDIINYLLDSEVYGLIKELRKKDLSVNDCLNFLINKEELFDELLEKKFIFEAKGSVYLFSDIRFIKFTPYYILKTLINRYKNQEISLNQYLSHIELLIKGLEVKPDTFDYTVI